ncbi:folate-binding protein [Variovorax sp. YR752]|uniref:CAF17-like 4Fe-4S cluster assembly/insertion protein YgfZ n=1 Tax=Variovorax sp. YR752 TaxID=1884383 RepID=UPI003137C566
MQTDLATNGVATLTHWGVIRARGADAARFLHGQLTNDMLALDRERALLAGFCSAKGRLQASFLVWQGEADEILLACSADVLAPTLKRLSMFVLRAQCKLSDASAELPLHGLAGAAASTLLGDAAVWQRRDTAAGTLIRLPDSQGMKRALLAGGVPVDAPLLSLDTWRWLELGSGVPTIEAATVEQFVPQMINLELVGGVDFKKGCYPGQEVVARSQYRGTLKRRMFLFDVVAVASAGQEIFHSADPGQPAGLVANAAPSPEEGSRLLAEVKLAALDSGTLHLGSAEGPPLTRRELPYTVPFEGSAAA